MKLLAYCVVIHYKCVSMLPRIPIVRVFILWLIHDIKAIGRSVASTALAALVGVIKMPVGIFAWINIYLVYFISVLFKLCRNDGMELDAIPSVAHVFDYMLPAWRKTIFHLKLCLIFAVPLRNTFPRFCTYST